MARRAALTPVRMAASGPRVAAVVQVTAKSAADAYTPAGGTDQAAPDPEGTLPNYSYACTECGHAFDIYQSFSDDTLTSCPQCQGVLRKKFAAVGVVFKGSGFYRNDARSNSSTSAGSAKSETAKDGASKESASASSSDSGAGAAKTTKADGAGSAGSGGSASSGSTKTTVKAGASA